MVHLEPDDRVDFVEDLLIGILIQFVIIEADHYLRVISIHGLINSSVYRKVKHLNVAVEHDILFQFLQELGL